MLYCPFLLFIHILLNYLQIRLPEINPSCPLAYLLEILADPLVPFA